MTTYTIYGPHKENNILAKKRAFDSYAYTWGGVADEAIAANVITEPGVYFIHQQGSSGAFITVEPNVALKVVA